MAMSKRRATSGTRREKSREEMLEGPFLANGHLRQTGRWPCKVNSIRRATKENSVTNLEMDHELRCFPTELGWMAVAVTDLGVAQVVFGYPSSSACLAALQRAWSQRMSRTVRVDRLRGNVAGTSKADRLDERVQWADDVQQQLTEYADGDKMVSDTIPLDLTCRTEFQRRVMMACRLVGYGQTASYLELAQRAGASRAARAVGSVMARNPLPLLIPCHRIVATAGLLGGFSAPEGLTMKRRLLALEQTGLSRQLSLVAAKANGMTTVSS